MAESSAGDAPSTAAAPIAVPLAAQQAPRQPLPAGLSAAARLRARLLEFLKFRVLAAQGEFFETFRADSAAGAAADVGADAGMEPADDLDAELLRRWLRPLWPEALALGDAELRETFRQARRLYGP